MWLVYFTCRIYLLCQQRTPSLPLSRWSSTLAGTILLPLTRTASEPKRDWITCGPGGSGLHGNPQVRAHGSLTILKKETMDWMIGRIQWLNNKPNSLSQLMILRHMSGGRLKNRAEERTQMLQQLSHVRNGQAKKDEGLQVETKAKQYIYIYMYLCYVYVQQYCWGTESCISWHSKYSKTVITAV